MLQSSIIVHRALSLICLLCMPLWSLTGANEEEHSPPRTNKHNFPVGRYTNQSIGPEFTETYVCQLIVSNRKWNSVLGNYKDRCARSKPSSLLEQDRFTKLGISSRAGRSVPINLCLETSSSQDLFSLLSEVEFILNWIRPIC